MVTLRDHVLPGPLSMLNAAHARFDGPLPANVLDAIAAANKDARSLSPRQRLVQDMIAWRLEVDDRRNLLKILSARVVWLAGWIGESPAGSDRLAIAEGAAETLRGTWALHASLLIQAAREERRARKALAAMLPALVAAE